MSLLGLGRPTQGGAWGRWLCEGCNGRTGLWDEEYLRWQKPLLLAIHDSEEPPRQVLLGEFSNADPGAFVRCLWAWMFALDGRLLESYRSLAEAVLSGEPVDPPSDIRLLIGVTTSLRMWLTNQDGAVRIEGAPASDGWYRHGSGLWATSPELLDVPLVVVAAPPFNVVLASSTQAHRLPHLDTGPWLRDAAENRRSTRLDLPMVTVLGEGAPGVISYEQIVSARARPETVLGDTG